MSARRLSGAAAGAAAAILLAGVAHAQMQLPGAIGGGAGSSSPPSGTPTHGGGGAAPPVPAKPVVIAAPGEGTISGHPLSRDGVKGEMVLDKSGDGLALSKLTLAGEKISAPGQACTVLAPLPQPLAAQAAGRPAGTIRYAVPLAGCAFDLDILNGSVLVTSPAPTCDFAAADCRVGVGGLWGPHAAEITPKRAKDLERERVHLETTMRANFRALIKKAGKDRNAVKAIARDQAAFSSEREMTCRDYEGETTHGFCSTQVTEARALALLAQFGPLGEAHEHRRGSRLRGTKAGVGSDEDEPPN